MQGIFGTANDSKDLLNHMTIQTIQSNDSSIPVLKYSSLGELRDLVQA